MKEKYVNLYMKMSVEVAKLSYANRLKVGSVIVKDDRMISLGYNGTAKGWDNQCEDENNKTKPEVIHSEANAISKLAASTESGKGATMFVTHAPCIECAKLIYGAGIVEVYYEKDYRDPSGIEFLKKCGIYVNRRDND